MQRFVIPWWAIFERGRSRSVNISLSPHFSKIFTTGSTGGQRDTGSSSSSFCGAGHWGRGNVSSVPGLFQTSISSTARSCSLWMLRFS
jgi:hypothetical protein